MTHNVRVAVASAIAFGAGFAASHLSAPARADAPAPITVLPQTAPTDLPRLVPSPGPNHLRSRELADTPGATVTYYVISPLKASGSLPVHYHLTANEIQYVISGTGWETFGGKTYPIGPGSFMVIPPGTLHAGLKGPPGTQFKLLVVKTPVQGPNDVHTPPPPLHPPTTTPTTAP